MTNNNCGFSFNCNCLGLATLASIIIGVVTAILTFNAVIAVTPAFLWVVFGIAVVYLAVVLAVTGFARRVGTRCCVCARISYVLAGVLGTVLTSVVLLAVTFAATSVLGAIITGVLLFFFSLLITSVACLAKCLSGCTDYEE